jgi:hypothetical protein
LDNAMRVSPQEFRVAPCEAFVEAKLGEAAYRRLHKSIQLAKN